MVNLLNGGLGVRAPAEDGDPIGRAFGDDKAIVTLTGLLARGLTDPRRSCQG
jgi:hypothetical protein